MTHITSIDTEQGVVTINSELFQGYVKEAFEYLDASEEAFANFKEVVETVAETTGMKKALVSKYLKARYAQATKDTKDLGNLFEALDSATGVV